jgi:hypothetical protein
VLYELRITARGGGADMRELRGRFGDESVGGGVFQTEVGETGQTLIIWPRDTAGAQAAPRQRGAAGSEGEGEGRLARNPLGKHTMELLRLAPFMAPPAPRQVGRVWELRWFDYPAGTVSEALAGYDTLVENVDRGFPLAGCWSVEVGPVADRIYLLAGYRDWDHRDAVTSRLASDAQWPPPTDGLEAINGGARILIPAAFSPFR